MFKLRLCCSQSLSRVHLFATPWAVAYRALLSMGFSRQEHSSGLLCPPPGDLPNSGKGPGIEPRSLKLQEDSLPSEPPGKPKLRLEFQFFNSWLFKSGFVHYIQLIMSLSFSFRFPSSFFLVMHLPYRFSQILFCCLHPCGVTNHGPLFLFCKNTSKAL